MGGVVASSHNSRRTTMPAWAGGWDAQFGQPYALRNERDTLHRRVGMAYQRDGMQIERAIDKALNGVAPGATATAAVRKVEALQSVGALNLGGKRNIVSQTIINRATTAADKTALDAIYDAKFAPTTYPVDKSGMGGGGKVSTL